MKKVWLLIAVIAIVSCKNEAPIDYALVSGKITNATTNEATIYGLIDRDFREKMTLSEDGSFKDTLKAGSYLFSQGKNRAPLYLSAGDNITINFDAKNFKSSLTFSGKGSEINVYLGAKGAKEKELMGAGTGVYVKEEADYKKVVYEIKTAQEELLAAASGISSAYKEKENRTVKTIGNFKVELGDQVIMIRDLKDNLLKAESVRASEGEDRYKEVCENLEKKIAERKEKGLSV